MTSSRLATIAQRSDRLRLTLVHATGDAIIPWRHCEDLFYLVASAVYGGETPRAEIDDRKETWDLGDGGWLCVAKEGNKIVKQRIVKYGGKYAILISTVPDIFRARCNHEMGTCRITFGEML